MCFIKCTNSFTEKDYTEDLLAFIRNEKYRLGLMTSARVPPFCINYKINNGCFDGKRINPGNITEGNISMFIYNNHFCIFWESNNISFNQAIEELNVNYKVIDNVISDNHFESFIENEYKPEKIQSPLTNIDAYDLDL